MPGPDLSRNLAIVLFSFSGASSWMHEVESPTSIIASATPCSSFTSRCAMRIPYFSS